MKIYTKTGDGGTSSTAISGRVSKSELIFELLGTLDELDSFLGYGMTYLENHHNLLAQMQVAQKNLYTIMALLHGARVEVDLQSETKKLETSIDAFSESLPKITNFILPSGSRGACAFHLARTVCRRAERVFVAAIEAEKLEKISQKEAMLAFINRLSDYFFTVARVLSEKEDVVK